MAIFPTFTEGSIPIDFTFNFFRGFNKIPSLEPISTTKLYFFILMANLSKCSFSYLFISLYFALYAVLLLSPLFSVLLALLLSPLFIPLYTALHKSSWFLLSFLLCLRVSPSRTKPGIKPFQKTYSIKWYKPWHKAPA